MNKAVLSLGSNVGDKVFYLQEAVRLLNARVGEVVEISSVYETEPWGMECDGTFYNIALLLKTKLTPFELLKESLQIESKLGRVRISEGYAPRTIDIDILFYNDEIINTKELIVPHPHIQKRNFVLAPLTDIIPDFQHPALKKSIKYLNEHSEDDCLLRKIEVKIEIK